MEQLVILLVIGAVGLIKWVLEKAAEQRARSETEERIDDLERAQPPEPPRRGMQPIDSFPKPDVAARRLREALGLPDDYVPPPRRQTPPAPPAFRIEEVKGVPSVDLERRVMEQPTQPFQKSVFVPPVALLQEEPVSSVRSGLDELLRSREGLRKAILMQEILGTPKGLVF